VDGAVTNEFVWSACGVVALAVGTWLAVVLGLFFRRRTKQATAEHVLARLNDAVRDAVRAVNQSSSRTFGLRKPEAGFSHAEQATLRRYAVDRVKWSFGPDGLRVIGGALGLHDAMAPDRHTQLVERMIETKVEAFVWLQKRRAKGY